MSSTTGTPASLLDGVVTAAIWPMVYTPCSRGVGLQCSTPPGVDGRRDWRGLGACREGGLALCEKSLVRYELLDHASASLDAVGRKIACNSNETLTTLNTTSPARVDQQR